MASSHPPSSRVADLKPRTSHLGLPGTALTAGGAHFSRGTAPHTEVQGEGWGLPPTHTGNYPGEPLTPLSDLWFDLYPHTLKGFLKHGWEFQEFLLQQPWGRGLVSRCISHQFPARLKLPRTPGWMPALTPGSL